MGFPGPRWTGRGRREDWEIQAVEQIGSSRHVGLPGTYSMKPAPPAEAKEDGTVRLGLEILRPAVELAGQF